LLSSSFDRLISFFGFLLFQISSKINIYYNLSYKKIGDFVIGENYLG